MRNPKHAAATSGSFGSSSARIRGSVAAVSPTRNQDTGQTPPRGQRAGLAGRVGEPGRGGAHSQRPTVGGVDKPVRLLEERRFDPPRLVDVEHDGAWWAGIQRAW